MARSKRKESTPIVEQPWRNQSNYPDPLKAGSRGWAWQFLRRNAEYRAAWREYLQACAQAVELHPQLQPWVEFLLSSGKSNFYDRYSMEAAGKLSSLLHDVEHMQRYDPPRQDGEDESSWARRAVQAYGYAQIIPIRIALGERFGLSYIANPKLKSAGLVTEFRATPLRVLGPGFNLAKALKSLGESHCAVLIDLRFPLETILAAVGQMSCFKRERGIESGTLPPEKRFQPDKLLRYLQVLDAVESGASISDIAAALPPCNDDRAGRKTVRNWRDQGIRIRDEDWLLLAMSNDADRVPNRFRRGPRAKYSTALFGSSYVALRSNLPPYGW